jgi:hypothetical protein
VRAAILIELYYDSKNGGIYLLFFADCQVFFLSDPLNIKAVNSCESCLPLRPAIESALFSSDCKKLSFMVLSLA